MEGLGGDVVEGLGGVGVEEDHEVGEGEVGDGLTTFWRVSVTS